MHGKERAQHGNEILLRLSRTHRLREAAERHAEKFLNDLIADDPLTGVRGSADEISRLFLFRGGPEVEGINEDIGVEKKSTAHSFLPACRGRRSAHVVDGASAHPLRLRPLPAPRTAPATPARRRSRSCAAIVLPAAPARLRLPPRSE